MNGNDYSQHSDGIQRLSGQAATGGLRELHVYAAGVGGVALGGAYNKPGQWSPHQWKAEGIINVVPTLNTLEV
jgi:hypothetical protein